MLRYILPAAAFLLIAVAWLLPWENQSFSAPETLLALYGVATLWWVIVAARAPPPYWPHVIAVWVPAVLPVGLMLWPLWGPNDGIDNGIDNGIGVVVMAPLAAITLLICAAGALTLRINRQERARLKV